MSSETTVVENMKNNGSFLNVGLTNSFKLGVEENSNKNDDYNNDDNISEKLTFNDISKPQFYKNDIKNSLRIKNPKELNDYYNCSSVSLDDFKLFTYNAEMRSTNYEDDSDNEEDTIKVISYSDKELGELSFVDADWNHDDSKFFNPYMTRDQRRRLRKPLTDKYCQKTLYLFLRSLLMTALEREWMTEGEDWNYYVFNPYNISTSSWGSYSIDKFSDLSSKKSIGIKTKLDERSANVILSCLYVLYNKFELTSDEVIFESNYREGVLMQDSTFELAKYYTRITDEHPDMLVPLTSILSENFQLVPSTDNSLQFDIWKLTYSNQTKKVIPSGVGNNKSLFMTIEEILSEYDENWLNNSIKNDSSKQSSSIVTSALDTLSSIVYSANQPTTKSKEEGSEEEKTPLMPKQEKRGETKAPNYKPLNTIESIYEMAFKQQDELNSRDMKTVQESVNSTADFMSPPPTPRKKDNNDYHFVDSVIKGIMSWFSIKEKKE